MPGNYTITTRASGTILTAAIYNADHQNHVDNNTPQGVGGYSANQAQMQTQTSPGTIGGESLATSVAGELERLRFMLATITGNALWYDQTNTPFGETYVVSAAPTVSGSCDISAIKQRNIQLSATSGVLSNFGPVPAGQRRVIWFTAAAPGILTAGANLTLPGGNSITLNQFDVAEFFFPSGTIGVLMNYLPYLGGPASIAECFAGTNLAKWMSPGAFAGGNTKATNGIIKLPGGFIFMWGALTGAAVATGSTSLGFPTPFPNICYKCMLNANSGLSGGSISAVTIASSGVIVANTSSVTVTPDFMAIGA